MKTHIDDRQIQSYRDNGYLVYPGFLDRAEIEDLKAAVLAALDSMGSRTITGDGPDLKLGDEYYAQVYTQKLNLWRISDAVRSYVARPELGKMLCQLEGICGVRVWHDQALIKEPFANPTALHMDNPYWSFHSPHAVTIWIALEDATVENGCLRFFPGSHKVTKYDQVKLGAEFGSIFKFYPELKNISPAIAPMKAGDCSFHNGLTVHGASVNMTGGRRIAMTCAYMPDGSTYNGQLNVLPPRYAQTLTAGDMLNDEEQNPLVFVQDAM